MTRSMHLASLNNGLGTRLVVAFKQIKDDPLHALVINIDKLVKTVDRDELMAMVHSFDAQTERDFINVLHRKNLLEFYYKAGYFEKVSIDDVIMTPDASTRIPLREVLNAINAQNGLGPLPTKDQLASLSMANPLAQEKKNELLLKDGNAGIAKTKIMQGKLMLDEVNKIFNEAIALDPSTAPIIAKIKGGAPLSEIKVAESKADRSHSKRKTSKKK